MNSGKISLIIAFSVYFCLTFGKMDNEDYIDQPSEREIIIKIEKTNRKLDSIQLMIPDLEENMTRKLFSLKTSILEKLEEYMDRKLNNLETTIPEKIKQYMNCNSDTTNNKSFEKLEENLNFKIDVLAKNISNQLEDEKNCKCEAVNKITYFEQNMNKKLEHLEKNIQMNINLNLNALTNNISKEFEENITCKSDSFINITGLDNNINRKLEVLDKKILTKLEENIHLELYALTTNISKELEINNNFILNALKNKTVEELPDYTNVDCGNLPPLLYGSAELLHSSTHLGSVVQYSCATNYRLVGPARRICTKDFQWSDTAPTCEVDCGKLPLILHGSTELLNGTTLLGTVVQYSCTTNYRLVGPAQRICTKNFQWSETAPTCEADCGNLPLILHGSVELLHGTTLIGSVVQYSCATNYRLVGPTRRTCTKDFQWSETAPICEVLPCKEETIFGGYTSWYSLDDVSLRHYGTQRRDSTGHRAYWELHFAVQAGENVVIDLSEIENYSAGIRYHLSVGWHSPTHTYLDYNGARVLGTPTPDILSSTQFRSFYIKINDGKLQFGKEGDPPLISHAGDVGSLNYYTFYSGGASKIRFCPTPVEGSS